MAAKADLENAAILLRGVRAGDQDALEPLVARGLAW